MISHQTPAPPPLITQPPTPLLLQISRTAFCLNPAKTVSFPHNPTSPDLPGPVWITSPNYPRKPPGPRTSSSVRSPMQGNHARLVRTRPVQLRPRGQRTLTEGSAKELPPHRSYDHQIDLEEGTSPPFGKIYNMSKIKLRALKEYLDDMLGK
ncbi:hypothetical protein C0989_000481, partial [Termitomyces sp. Mn162]